MKRPSGKHASRVAAQTAMHCQMPRVIGRGLMRDYYAQRHEEAQARAVERNTPKKHTESELNAAYTRFLHAKGWPRRMIAYALGVKRVFVDGVIDRETFAHMNPIDPGEL